MSKHYPMNNLAEARESMHRAERDHRSGVLDDFQYADIRAMLTETLSRYENDSVKRTVGAGRLRFTEP